MYAINDPVTLTAGPYKGKAGVVVACETRDGANVCTVLIPGVVEVHAVPVAHLSSGKPAKRKA